MGASTIPAHASESGGSTASSSSTGVNIQGFNAQDWRDVQQSALKSGDRDSAGAAAAMAEMKSGNSHEYNIVTNIAKRAAIAALRHGEKKLPAKISPYAGIPVGVADAAATWIVTFLPVP